MKKYNNVTLRFCAAIAADIVGKSSKPEKMSPFLKNTTPPLVTLPLPGSGPVNEVC
jgi:hypothetical protein